MAATAVATPPRTGLSNNKLAMWLFLGSRVPAVRRPDLHLHALPRPARSDGPDARPDLRHPVHVGQLVRAADELAHDGAGRVAVQARRRAAAPRCGSSSPRCSAPRSSAARSTSSPPFYREGLGFTTSLFGVELLHADRLPRRPRHGRHHHADVARRDHAARSRVAGDKAEVVELVGLYWHFVDIVWIVIFTLVYLIPA